MVTHKHASGSCLTVADRRRPAETKAGRRSSFDAEPWYAPNRWLSSPEALSKQEAVVQVLEQAGATTPRLDEADLFSALHACAFQYGRARTQVPREHWLGRWRAVREHIVQANLGLVYSMISRFNSAQVDSDDLCSEAMYALYRAVERYNPWKGYRFSTYACNCIARACIRQRKREHRKHQLSPVSFDTPWNLTTEAPDDAEALRLERLKHAMDTNAASLNALERRILDERFPRSDTPARTFKQIARVVGLSKERVRQIQNIALDKLKLVLQEDALLQ